MQIDIKRAVTGGKKVKFLYYFDGSLWYETEFQEKFPVPVSDIGTATFNAEEKAILLMRYMRFHNKVLSKANNEEENQLL